MVGPLGSCQNLLTVHLLALLRTRKQDGVIAFGGIQGQLIEGEDLARGPENVAAHIKCIHLQFGHLLTCKSLVIVPTTSVVLSSLLGSFIFQIIWERDRGGWLVQLMNNLFSTWLKVKLFPLTRDLYSLTNSLR